MNLIFSGNRDQSRNPISSIRIIYIQSGSAFQYTVKVQIFAHLLYFGLLNKKSTIETTRKALTTTCCDHVKKCFKYSKINLHKIVTKLRFTNESLAIPGIM